MFFAACAFLMLMLLISWVGYRLIYKPGRFLRQLGQPVITNDAQRGLGANGEPEPGMLVTVLQQIGSRVPSSDAEVANLKADMIRAGFRSEHALPVFYGIRIVSTLTMLALCIMLEARMPNNMVMKIGLMATGIGAGWILPRFFLEKKVAKRKEVLRLSLPDALDLLVVSVEAGLGLDQAIQHVARELHGSHPQLSEEMSLVTLEMRAGKRRSDALRNFAERTGEAEFRKLVAILIQNDRFGTSMGESLRTHSDFLRTRRRQEAEERAGKVGVKLVFPIFFFILPSMLVVAAGPGLLQIFKYLFPMMKQMG
ncbi:MAG TPA: type II secretion system F family protein [Candidatus Acidoferrales bacterium]|nr:type II secretion system F family protein [Candidatus Acidoferrales bacterium]